MDYRYARSWMWSEAIRMLDEADRLRHQFFRLQEQSQLGPSEAGQAAGVWEPPVDVYETDESWMVLVALPGVPSERIRYRLDGDSVDIVAERSIPSQCSDGAIRRKEIPHGRFVRRLRFRVAPVEISQAALKDGCLMLSLRKPKP